MTVYRLPGDNKPFTRIQGLNSSSDCIPPPRREKTRHWETSFRSLFTGQTSYLLGLTGPHQLDSYRVETHTRLGVNLRCVLVLRCKKNISVIPVYLAFCVHTVWVLLSLLNFTKVSCEGYLKKGVEYKL